MLRINLNVKHYSQSQWARQVAMDATHLLVRELELGPVVGDLVHLVHEVVARLVVQLGVGSQHDLVAGEDCSAAVVADIFLASTFLAPGKCERCNLQRFT